VVSELTGVQAPTFYLLDLALQNDHPVRRRLRPNGWRRQAGLSLNHRGLRALRAKLSELALQGLPLVSNPVQLLTLKLQGA